MDSTSPRIIRVDPATVIIFSVLFSPALFMSLMLIWRGQQIPDGIALFALYVVGVYWICSPSIELDQHKLTYRALLKRGTIMLSEVAAVKISANPAPTILFLRKKPATDSFSFIIKPFSKAGVVALLHHLREGCPGARFDEIAIDLSNDDFDSITRATISTRNLIRIVFSGALAAFIYGMVRTLLHHL
jgi:hypothetical protein